MTATSSPPTDVGTDSGTDGQHETSASSSAPDVLDEERTSEPATTESDEPSDDFDAAHAKTCAGRIIRDMKTVDQRLPDGIAVDSALSLLSGSPARQ